MKRAFAVVIVVLLALGMIGLFCASFLAQPTTTVGTPTTTYTTTPAPTDSASGVPTMTVTPQ